MNLKSRSSNHIKVSFSFQYQRGQSIFLKNASNNGASSLIGFNERHDSAADLHSIKSNQSGINSKQFNADDFGVSTELRNKDNKNKYNLDIWRSDAIPLDRRVPDSRPKE